MGNLWSLVRVLSGILAIWKQFQAWLAAQRKADKEAKEVNENKAVEDAKKATTPEEAFDAQERIVSNKS